MCSATQYQVLVPRSVVTEYSLSTVSQALLEERKLYCFVLDHLYSVIRNEVAYNATVSKLPTEILLSF